MALSPYKTPGLLPPDNPISQWVEPRRNALLGFGAGMLSRDLGDASRGAMQGMALDRQYAMDAQQQAQDQQARNQTVEWLKSKGYGDLVAGVEGGALDVQTAWGEALKRSQPAPAPDPFTLGEGQVRYDGMGNVIAQGPASTPETVINNSMGGSDKFYDTIDAEMAKQTSAAIESGYNAQSNNLRLQQLEGVLATAPQGVQGAMVQIAGQYGIPVQGLDDVQAAQALINQMVPAQRPPGSGPMSDRDIELFKASLPQIINQPGGNQQILRTMKAINEYTIVQAEIAQRVANREISPAEGRALQARVPNPLAGLKSNSGTSGNGPTAVNPTTGEKVRWNGTSWEPVR